MDNAVAALERIDERTGESPLGAVPSLGTNLSRLCSSSDARSIRWIRAFVGSVTHASLRFGSPALVPSAASVVAISINLLRDPGSARIRRPRVFARRVGPGGGRVGVRGGAGARAPRRRGGLPSTRRRGGDCGAGDGAAGVRRVHALGARVAPAEVARGGRRGGRSGRRDGGGDGVEGGGGGKGGRRGGGGGEVVRGVRTRRLFPTAAARRSCGRCWSARTARCRRAR